MNNQKEEKKIKNFENSFKFIGGNRKKGIKKKNFKSRPLISIITVVKNDEKKIEKTILSLLNQSYSNYEIIIIDGFSKDKTLKKIRKYNNKIDIWISKKDKNLWEAFNTGIKLCRGSIIGILNSGDIYYKDALLTVSKYFLKKRIDFLFGSVQKTKIYHGFEPEKIFYRMNIYPSHSCSFFIKRKAQMKIGYYDTNFNWCSDLDLFYRMIVKYKLKGVATKREEVIGKFDMRGISSKISKIAFYYYEMKVRYKNGQNFFYLLILFNLKVLNLIRNFLIFR